MKPKFKVVKTEEKEIKTITKLSPTKINTYYKCPREFFYNYIEKIRVPPNIHMLKGSIVHKILEDFYRAYKINSEEYIKELFKKTWEKNKLALGKLEITPEELENHKKDALYMVMDFYEVHQRKIKGMIIQGKAENEKHAFYFTKPKLKELYVKDDNLKCGGYIDRIHKDYNGIITLGDYKTSSKFGIGLPEDYRRQLSIYALLYSKQENIIPDFISVIFLRYGEEVSLEVTPNLLEYARQNIIDVYNKTRSVDIKDYIKKEGRLCKWCSFQSICSGKEEQERKKRIEKLKELIQKQRI